MNTDTVDIIKQKLEVLNRPERREVIRYLGGLYKREGGDFYEGGEGAVFIWSHKASV